MALIEPETDDYRLFVAGPLEKYWYKYGFAPSGWPAYTKTGKILDTGLISWEAGGVPYWHFDITTSALLMNCRGQYISTHLAGGQGGGPIRALVLAKYERVKKAVHYLNPLPLSIVDIRTIEQVKGGCCPKAILALMLGSEGD